MPANSGKGGQKGRLHDGETDCPLVVTIIPSETNRLERALSSFVERVREARFLYDRDRDENAGRTGCMVALTAAYDFCKALGIQEEGEPFSRLLLALIDADTGAEDPLTLRKRLGVKAPIPMASKIKRGYVAAAVEAIFQEKKDLKGAAGWVARRIRHLPIVTELQSKTSISKAIKNWRDAAMAGQYGVDLDTTMFRDACSAMETSGHRGEIAAKILLEKAEKD